MGSALCNVREIVVDEEYFSVISRRKHMQVPKKEREKTDSSVTDNKCTKECDARAMLLFCYCCFDVLVAVNWEECKLRV